MRIAIDYRPALRARTGVGEHIHEVTRELARTGTEEVTIFSSSWKDRLQEHASQLPGVRTVDCRIPVSLLNLAWHRLEWPSIESLARHTFDVAHSPHPLLMPSRSAAQVVTVHDVDFMTQPDRAAREIRRDYPTLAARHAQRADQVIVVSQYVSGEVQRMFGVPPDRISICPNGAPRWQPRSPGEPAEGYILFTGTISPRKNVGGLLDSYERLLSRAPDAPPLRLAGASDDSEGVLDRLTRAPLAGRVQYAGYVPDEQREALFKGASIFVLPSLNEGFGIPVLEAMAAGVPVIASNRGALPEVVGEAGIVVDPADPEALTTAMQRLLTDAALRTACVRRGLERVSQFSWEQTARGVRRAYEAAIDRHAHRH